MCLNQTRCHRRPTRSPVSVPITLAYYKTRQSLHRVRQQIRQGQNPVRIEIITDVRPSMNYSNLSSKWNSTVPHSATSTVCECLLEHNMPAITDTVYHERRLQQDRQYTYNVILRRLRASIVAAEKQ